MKVSDTKLVGVFAQSGPKLVCLNAVFLGMKGYQKNGSTVFAFKLREVTEVNLSQVIFWGLFEV